MVDRAALLTMTPGALRGLLAEGHPIDPTRLDNTAYRGISLGLPRWVEHLSWKTFQKTFYRDPSTGHLRGWNVRVVQRGLDAPSAPRLRAGRPFTFGHYRVTAPDPARAPRGFDRGLVIDYGLAPHPRFDLGALLRDPIVALDPGSVDRLLGASFVALGAHHLATPSFFLLEREGPIGFVP